MGEQFEVRPKVVGGANELANRICAHSPFSVFLVALCLEWLTQKHYVECFQEEEGVLDPAFQKVFRLHWMEEAQHARVDALHLRRIAPSLTEAELERGLAEMEAILAYLREVVEQQDAYDVESFSKICGRSLSPAEESEILAALKRESRWTFFDSGLQHKAFKSLCQDLFPAHLLEPVAALAVA